MPSPFPGMDPYLENPSKWPDHHHELISEIRAELNRQLRPRYFARLEERVYLTDENDPARVRIIPDVRVMASTSEAWRGSPGKGTSSGTGTIEPIEVTTFIDDEIHEARIEVLDAQDRSVVTVIEILSPSNKIPGSRGQQSYLTKRREVMLSPSHLVEIDLLRSGARIYVQEDLPPHEYLVHVSRSKGNGRRRGTVWPIPIFKPLPEIPIPLRGNDPDAMIDLQQMLAIAYDRGAYELDLDYTREPVPPLTPEQSAWAKTLIAGLEKV